MTAPHWVVGLGRLVWYVGLAPLSLAHAFLTLLGGGEPPRWMESPLLLPFLGANCIWVIITLRIAGVLP